MTRWIADLLFDVRYAARTIAAQYTFAIAVALTLALGLGLNGTVFGMMDALLLRPFQFEDYQQIVVVFGNRKGTSEREPIAPVTYLAWRQQMHGVERLVAWEAWGATLGGRTEPERIQGFRVTPGFFETLGIHPPIGRTFHSSEEQPGNDRRAIIGDGLWKRRFGADPRIVGTEVLLDSIPHTVVGVAPPGFDFPVGSELWAPLAFTDQRAADQQNRSLTVFGKLAGGTSLGEARAELDVLAERLAVQYPDTHGDRGAIVRTLSAAFREDSAGALVGILQFGATLVLLVACANLTGLLLARANDREREVAIRTALGANRMRIVRQLVTETVLLALVASGLALLFARTGLELLRGSIPADMARYVEGWSNVRLDTRLVFVIPSFAVLIGLVVGLIPALSASRGDLTSALKDGDRSAMGGVRRQRMGRALVVAEITFALTLLAAAGLTFDGAVRMIEAPNGFDSRSLLTFNIPVPQTRYGNDELRREFASRLLARIEAVPAVERAALGNILPAAGWSPTRALFVEDAPVDDPGRRPAAGYRAVSPGYLETLGITVLSGRAFSTMDREDTQPVAIVSASLAARYWPGRDAVGRRLRLGDGQGPWLTVVGVAGDVTMYNWWDGVDLSAVYVPLRQAPGVDHMSAVVRTRGEPSALAGALRAAVADTDPVLALDNVRTMDQAIASSTFGLNFIARLLGICGAIALVLAVVGIYSMMAYAVSQRRHEFGVRMALGASASNILCSSLRQAAVLTAVGLALGLTLATIVGYFMAAALYGVIRLDAVTLLAVTGALAAVALAAAYVPAARSVAVDPATTLRRQ